MHEQNQTGPGFIQHHVTTGLEHLFEGITVATIQNGNEKLTPLMRGVQETSHSLLRQRKACNCR